MDNSGGEVAWRFGKVNPSLEAASAVSIRALVHGLYNCVDRSDPRPLAPLGHGDPSPFACFRAAAAAEEAVAAAATSGKYNSYPPPLALPRRAVDIAWGAMGIFQIRDNFFYESPTFNL
ncbi:hypothetical protein HU200_066188 [Digitaria exilis]|uniref:Uncharacterized protein n=1 Tax=Digitaria exilis TaxID=1010633 RepID=A0A834ZXF0_9POAL|nr:hypothetical protein HU200_066188 [Digitaria exilis]